MASFAAAASALALLLAAPALAAIETLDELEACVKANLPERSSVQVVLFRSTDRVDQVSESRARIYWQRDADGLSRVMLRVSDPPDQRGAGVLLLQKESGRSDMFLYMPELAKVRRVTSRMVSGSLFGTDFSYEDFERLQGLAQGQSSEIRGSESLDDRAVVVVESRPGPDSGSAYERTVTRFDAETCIPLRSELYERGDRLRKVLTVDRARVSEDGGRFVPRALVMEDVRDGTRTELVVEELDLEAAISRKMFSVRELETGGR